MFHFGQCIWHQIQSLRLRKEYLDDKLFHLNVKKLIALAFVSVSDVNKGFDVVADGFGDGAEDLLGYFKKTWIGKSKRKCKLLVYQAFFNILFLFQIPAIKNRCLQSNFGMLMIERS